LIIRRIGRWLARIAAIIAVLFAGLWGALAIWFGLHPASPWHEILTGGFALLALAAAVCLALQRWRVVALFAVLFVVVLGSWASLRPSNDRAWAPDVAKTAAGTVEGNRLVIKNVRNFVWRSDSDFDARWETRSFDLNQLQGADLIMSYWSGETIAHTILSFGFSDGQHLAFSIEVRREKSQPWSALAGFFSAYELAFVAADERDVLGVRTNVRGEDVRIYRLRMKPAQARSLLIEYVNEANDLAREPRFYNSLTANCSTQIYSMVRTLRKDVPWDYRIVLDGHLPDYIYELGGLDTAVPFANLRESSHIQGKASSLDPDFSQKIREGIPVFSAQGQQN